MFIKAICVRLPFSLALHFCLYNILPPFRVYSGKGNASHMQQNETFQVLQLILLLIYTDKITSLDIDYALQDSFDVPLLDEWDLHDNTSGYFLSSSDDEDSDGEIVLASLNDVDLPSVSVSNKDALTVTAHRLATLGWGHRRRRQVCRT